MKGWPFQAGNRWYQSAWMPGYRTIWDYYPWMARIYDNDQLVPLGQDRCWMWKSTPGETVNLDRVRVTFSARGTLRMISQLGFPRRRSPGM